MELAPETDQIRGLKNHSVPWWEEIYGNKEKRPNMFVFIWGTKGQSDHLGYIILECPACHQTGPFSVFQIRKKFTVYFIPTFSYSNKQYIVCSRCNASFEVPKDKKKDLESSIMSQEQLSRLIARLAQENAKSVETKTLPSAAATAYCTKCGQELGADDAFCPKCGTKRKVI